MDSNIEATDNRFWQDSNIAGMGERKTDCAGNDTDTHGHLSLERGRCAIDEKAAKAGESDEGEMTAAEIIAELQKFPPHLPVRVVTTEVYHADELGESQITLCEEDATEADFVSYQGTHILIQGK